MKVDIASLAKHPEVAASFEALMASSAATDDAEKENVLATPTSPTIKRRRERLQQQDVALARNVDYKDMAKRVTRSLKFEDAAALVESLPRDVIADDTFATFDEDGQVVLIDKEGSPTGRMTQEETGADVGRILELEGDAGDATTSKGSSPLTFKSKHSLKINVTYVPEPAGSTAQKVQQQVSSPVLRSPYGFPSSAAVPTRWKRSKELHDLIASRRKPQLDRSLLAKRPEEEKDMYENGVEGVNHSATSVPNAWASTTHTDVYVTKAEVTSVKTSLTASFASSKSEVMQLLQKGAVAEVEVEVVEKRRCPRRQYILSWVPTDASQLAYSEKLILKKLTYHQACIAGLNTISTEDISHLDDSRRTARSADPEPAASCEGASSAGAAEKDDREILILIHGFGGGLAGWAQNWQFFSDRFKVYAFDLPGFARSERKKTKASNLTEAMDVMCGYFDRWFKILNFPKPVIVLAHSFGSFISAHFTMRHGASLVKMLLFADPWGVHRGSRKKYKSTTFGNKFLLYFFYTHRPLSLLRSTGPMGPYLMRKSRPDLANNWKDFLGNVKIMHDYIYHCNAIEPPMGEDLFKVCCHFDVAATQPLQDVLPAQWNKNIPIGFIFGEKSCYDATEPKAMADQMEKDGFTVAVDTVPNAGHQVFSDNVGEFNERVYTMIQSVNRALE